MKNIIVVLMLIALSAQSHAFTLASGSITEGWDKKELVFDVNETSCSGLGISVSHLNAVIDAAVDLWNSVPTAGIKIKKGAVVTGTAVSDPPVIYCTNSFPAGADMDFVVGLGSIGSIRAGRPITGSIQINGNSAKNAYFEDIEDSQQKVVIAHEMGHVLGLGHSESIPALMYYDVSSKQHLNLTQDDMDGLTWLNPRSEPGAGFMGCGTITDKANLPQSNGTGVSVVVTWAAIFALAYLATRRKSSFSL